MAYHTDIDTSRELKEDARYLPERELFGGIYLHPESAKKMLKLSLELKQNTFEVVCRTIDTMKEEPQSESNPIRKISVKFEDLRL